MLVTAVTPEQISPDIALQMQMVGYEAWLSAFSASRDQQEIKHMYDPWDPKYVAEVTKRYRELATRGVVSLALEKPFISEDRLAGNVRGFLLAANDVSGNVIARGVKRLFRPEKIYAWIQQLNVHPEYQDNGTGKELLEAGLRHFKPDQVPTTYIFDENQMVWNAALHMGFELSPPDQVPRVMHDYFGEDTTPVNQYRFAALSVQHVRARLNAHG